LFTDDGFLYLEIDMSRVPTNYSIKPIQISLPYPIYNADSRFTIFVSDPERDYTEKIQDFTIPQIAEVIGY
jgi:ribosome biogenesis protein UTP30